MDRQTIAAGWLTLRPFTPTDTAWVYEVSLDPLLQRFMQVPSPYRLEDAAFHVEQEYIGGGDGGRAEEDSPAVQLMRKFEEVAKLAARQHNTGQRCDPDQFYPIVFG